jgi:hypothetical protein
MKMKNGKCRMMKPYRHLLLWVISTLNLQLSTLNYDP